MSSTMDGRKIYVDYKYYGVSGLLRQVSNPYFHGMGETPQYSTYRYDHLGRNTRVDRADGSFMSKSYLSLTETTIGFDGQKTKTQYTNSGLVEFVISYDGTSNNPVLAIPFSYYGDGKVKTADAVTYRYDINRNPRAVADPSLGEMTYDYNAFGELARSTTPRNETEYTYDAIGRMVTRFDRDGQSYWYYDQGFKGVLSSTRYQPADGPATMETFVYDRLGNLTRQEQHIDGQAPWAFHYTYDALGRQNSITYPSGYKVKYQYNGKGFMERVKDAQTGEVLWQANATDRWGNVTGFTEGDIAVAYGHDPVSGLVTSIVATRNGQPLLDQSYHWTATGNLEWRSDMTLDLKERFGYDGFNRLVSATTRNLDETQTYSSQSFDYDLNGNITQKTGVGSYAYNDKTNPFAVTKMIPEEGQERLFGRQHATYTAFDKLRTLEQGNYRLAVDYGIDRQRVRQTFRRGSSTRTKRHFTPLYESITENGVTKNLHYLTAGSGLFAIFATQTNGASAMHYTLKDHQGSLAATVCGNAVERLSYDAWGRRRNPVGFGYSNVSHTFDRGFTLHEHYDDFNLINMNGRCYDPVIGRMLSPDIAIQDEYNAQAYNRYSYCFNNPLRFTDPSGYVVQMPFEYYGLEAFGYGYLGRHSFKGSSFNTEAVEGLQRPEDDWIYNMETKEYVWDDNVSSLENTPDGFEYVGVSQNDVYKHFRRNNPYTFVFRSPRFGANRTPWPGEINQADNLTSIEMWLDEPARTAGEATGKMMLNIAYSYINSPCVLFFGRTIGGTVATVAEKEEAFSDFVPGLLSAGVTKSGQIIKTTTNGLEGYNQFVRGAKKAGMQIGGPNWQKQASRYYHINKVNQQSLEIYGSYLDAIKYAGSFRNEFNKR
ncbi:MAG: hypothetical protein IJQ11_12900 [Bacteroidales bacterium]|nr:hypothetical protein [Bacteroidales bacterium]